MNPARPRERVCVVGAGLLGMTLALRLAGRGCAVTLLEAADRVGGLAAPWRLGDATWDRHYHVILPSDRRLLGLLDELGLAGDLRWGRTRTGCFAGGRLHSVSSTREFLRFPLLGLWDKLRLGFTLWHGARIRRGDRLEGMLVEEWLTRLSGRRAFARFWLPLLRSKLGESYRETAAAFMWATIRRLQAARTAGANRERLGTVRGGYQRILDRFRALLLDAGVEIRTGCPVVRVARRGGGIEVVADGAANVYDRAVLTVAAPLAASLCAGLTGEEESGLRSIRYQGIVCASLLLEQPLSDFYVTNLLDSGLPFTGIIEMTTLIDPREVGGRSLVYLPRYVPSDDALFSRPDAEIEDRFLAGLARVHPAFDRSDLRALRISRVRLVHPLTTLHYSRRCPPLGTSIPGLFLASSAHIRNGTLNVEETLRLAEAALPVITRR